MSKQLRKSMRKPKGAAAFTLVTAFFLFFGALSQAAASGSSASSGSQQTGSGGIVELSMFYDVSWIGEPYKADWEKTRIGRKLIEKTGVKVTVTNARTDDHQQLNMMLASGDLPDFVVTQMSDPTFSVMSESDAVLDYIPLIRQYAPELIDIMGQEYWDFYKNTSGVSNFFATCAFSPKAAEKYSAFGGWCGVLAAREDIWNAYGEPDISTPEKLLAHLQDVKRRYPDVKPMLFNPLENLSLGSTNMYGLNFFKEGFGVKAYYEKPDGSILAEYNDPEWINYIYWLNQLYAQGFLTREELGGGTDQLKSMKEQGNVYMYYQDGPNDLQYPPAGNPNVKYTSVPPFDKFLACQQGSLAWTTTFITKNCKNPEAAIKLISYMVSTEGDRLVQWGEEGVDWEFDANGAPRYTAWRLDQTLNNQTNYNNEKGNALFTMNWSDHEWTALGIVNEEPYFRRARELYQDHYYGKLNFMSIDPKGNIPEAVALQRCIDYYREMVLKMIMAGSRSEIDSLFTQMKSQLVTLGLPSVEKYWTAKSNTMKTAFKGKVEIQGADSVVYHRLYD